MNAEVEDQIRAAVRAKAETLREVRPLRLPSAPGAQPAGPGSGTRQRRAHRFRVWIAPVTAAAAVIALAISLVLVRDIPHGRVVYRPGPAAVAGSVPRYYAATMSVGRANGVIVNDTFTGARLATVKPPPGRTFGYVTAAADDRTFVVEAGPDTNDFYIAESWWYLLRIAPGTSHPARLTPLAIPDLQGPTIWALALSSSGRELAVGFGQVNRDPAQLRIYSVATGKLEGAWSTRDKTVFGAARAQGWGTATTTLTWVDDDRALAFSTQSADLNESTFTEVTHDTLRLLDKSAGGSDLIADSRVIWSAQSVIDLRTGSSQLRCAGGGPMLTADGKTIVCAATNDPPRMVPGRRLPPPEQWTLGWLAYSTSAPTAARTAARLSVDAPFSNAAWADLVWTDSSGSTLIGVWAGGSYPGPTIPPAYRSHWGVIANGEFRPLPTVPGTDYIFSIAW